MKGRSVIRQIAIKKETKINYVTNKYITIINYIFSTDDTISFSLFINNFNSQIYFLIFLFTIFLFDSSVQILEVLFQTFNFH